MLRTTECYHTCIMYRVWLQAECKAGALSMLSIHSPDYLLTVLVSIFISKTVIIFLRALVYIARVASLLMHMH